jgi:hypothetical protein
MPVLIPVKMKLHLDIPLLLRDIDPDVIPDMVADDMFLFIFVFFVCFKNINSMIFIKV